MISQEDKSNPAVPLHVILGISDTGVQHFGCWALANVGWGQADVQTFAKEEGALEAIQARIRGYLGSSIKKWYLAIRCSDKSAML